MRREGEEGEGGELRREGEETACVETKGGREEGRAVLHPHVLELLGGMFLFLFLLLSFTLSISSSLDQGTYLVDVSCVTAIEQNTVITIQESGGHVRCSCTGVKLVDGFNQSQAKCQLFVIRCPETIG